MPLAAPAPPPAEGSPPPTVSTFGAGDDTYCNQASPGTNYGSATSLRIGNYPGGKIRRALLRFNVASIPTSATVVKATLKLYVLQVFQGADRVRVHRATGAWAENTATWTNFPSFDPTLAAVASVNDTMVGTQIQIDVAKLVQLWVNKPTSNRGCVLQGTNIPSLRGAVFGSQEHPTGAKRPKLTVEYTP